MLFNLVLDDKKKKKPPVIIICKIYYHIPNRIEYCKLSIVSNSTGTIVTIQTQYGVIPHVYVKNNQK